MSAQIRIRTDQLDVARRAAKLVSNGSLARAMGIHTTTVSRTLSGDAQLTGNFIAALLKALGEVEFNDIFEIVGDDAAVLA